MCFGGGGQNTTSTTQIETLPEELVPFYEDLLDRGTYQSLTGYTPYPGRRLAEFDPYEGGAQEAYAEMALAGTPESFREAQSLAREAALGSPYQRAMMADQTTREMMRGVGEYRRERPRFEDVEASFGDFRDTRELTLPERRERYFSNVDEQQANPYVQQMNAISQQLSGLDPVLTPQDAATVLANIAVDGDYSQEEGRQIAGLINSGQMTVQEVADNFGMEVGEVQTALDQINTASLANIPVDGDYSEAEGRQVADLINSGQMSVQQIADNFGMEVGDVQTYLDQINTASVEQRTALEGEYEGLQTQLDESMMDADLGQVYTTMEEYMNPFQQTFVDRQKRLATEESERQQNEIAAQAAMSGGLGGYREGVMQSERERNLGNQLQDIQATGDIQNYQQARAAFEADRLANFQRAEYNRAGLGEAAQLGMQGYQSLGQDVDRRMMAGQTMSDLTGTRQAMDVSRLGQLEAAGQRRRALAQQGLDIGYGDFLRQQTFPIEQLNLYSSMLRGLPVGPGQSQAVYGTQPSAAQQLIGAGISGVGLYNAMSGGGGGGWGGG